MRIMKDQRSMIRLFQAEKLIRRTFDPVKYNIYWTTRQAIWNRPFYARSMLFELTLQIGEDDLGSMK